MAHCFRWAVDAMVLVMGQIQRQEDSLRSHPKEWSNNEALLMLFLLL